MRDAAKQSAENVQFRRARGALSEAKLRLRRDIGQLTDELGTLLPKYWSWVETSQYTRDRDKLLLLMQASEERLELSALEQVHRELCVLERTFTTALSGPQARKRRKTFI